MPNSIDSLTLEGSRVTGVLSAATGYPRWPWSSPAGHFADQLGIDISVASQARSSST